MSSSQRSSSDQPGSDQASANKPLVVKNLLGLGVVSAIGLAIYFIARQTPIPGVVAVLAGAFGGMFVGLIMLPKDLRAWLDDTFNRVPVIVLGSWLGMSLTMGSITVYMAKMQNGMHKMGGDMGKMRADMTNMSTYMGGMAGDIDSMDRYMASMSTDMRGMHQDIDGMARDMHAMNDDIQRIDDMIHGVDRTLEQEIGPAVRIMAPAVNDMGRSMHRGVQSFSNPMDYMRNSMLPFP